MEGQQYVTDPVPVPVPVGLLYPSAILPWWVLLSSLQNQVR